MDHRGLGMHFAVACKELARALYRAGSSSTGAISCSLRCSLHPFNQCWPVVLASKRWKTIWNHCKACNILAFSCACLVLTSNSVKYKGMLSQTEVFARSSNACDSKLQNYLFETIAVFCRGSQGLWPIWLQSWEGPAETAQLFLPVWKIVLL